MSQVAGLGAMRNGVGSGVFVGKGAFRWISSDGRWGSPEGGFWGNRPFFTCLSGGLARKPVKRWSVTSGTRFCRPSGKPTRPEVAFRWRLGMASEPISTTKANFRHGKSWNYPSETRILHQKNAILHGKTDFLR